MIKEPLYCVVCGKRHDDWTVIRYDKYKCNLCQSEYKVQPVVICEHGAEECTCVVDGCWNNSKKGE